jgi:glycosyltransferase involved in cell wall biosynthesis
MKFIFWSEPTFEHWDWTNPETKGIGGSETSHIEMSNRLADRGHEVWSYAPITKDSTDDVTHIRGRENPHGVQWFSSEHYGHKAAFHNAKADVWVIYRAPHVVELLDENQRAWLVCQDVEYPNMTEAHAERFQLIIALCERHAAHLRLIFPKQAHKVIVSSNGIRTEAIRKALGNPPERNPHRLIYASSPDRGFETLGPIYRLAKEIVPDLELHVYYGFNNIEKVITRSGADLRVKNRTDQIRKWLDAPGVVHHGRMGQTELYQEWMKAGIWCHPSAFTETSCITCMDAQALGAIPITTPTWAVGENVQHGVFIDGDIAGGDPLTKTRYVYQLVQMALQPEKQEKIRTTMMPWAQSWFDWENVADQWEQLALGENANISFSLKWHQEDTFRCDQGLYGKPKEVAA